MTIGLPDRPHPVFTPLSRRFHGGPPPGDAPPLGGTLELSDKRVDSATILTVTGRLDMTTSDAFTERLLALVAGRLPLVIDFSGVNYISSAGLRALMLASKQARNAGNRLAIAALQPVVLEIFQISRFDKLVPCYPTVDAALAAVR